MKRVLLTGARAPATLDLARRFHHSGHRVFLCDSLRFPIARFTRCKANYRRVPSPEIETEKFIDAINEIVRNEKIDFLIPTCEECFYLSLFRDQIEARVLVDAISIMDRLHNKFSFSQNFGNDHASVPKSTLLESHDDLNRLPQPATELVFKPVYSRFASKTLISPATAALTSIDISRSTPWIAQQRIFGRELSSFCLANHGELLAWSCYESPYRAGPGAGIYFRPMHHPKVLAYIKSFLTQTNYHGQIGFDFITDDKGQLWVLEANPRSTSGIHLFADDGRLADCFLGDCSRPPVEASLQPKMVASAMCLWGFAQAIKTWAPKRFAAACFHASDVLGRTNDPLPLLTLPVSFGELCWTAATRKTSLQAASTFGIEWNGRIAGDRRSE